MQTMQNNPPLTKEGAAKRFLLRLIHIVILVALISVKKLKSSAYLSCFSVLLSPDFTHDFNKSNKKPIGMKGRSNRTHMTNTYAIILRKSFSDNTLMPRA